MFCQSVEAGIHPVEGTSRPSITSVNGAADAKLHHDQVKVLPTEFEPVTLGSEDGRPIDVTGKPVAELRQSENREVPTVVPSPENPDFGPHFPVDLLEIIAAWNTLPEAVRAGVLAMVRATK